MTHREADRSADTVYEIPLRIRSEHVDATRHLRTSELFRLLQEASIAHTERLGFPREKTLDRGILWVIARQSVRIWEMPAYDEDVRIVTRPGKRMHYFFPRFYEMRRNGRTIIEGSALWMLISEETRTFVDPEEYGIRIPGDPGCPEVSLFAPIRLPDGASELFQSPFRARFSQIDINGHMNNARYFDLIEDLLEESGEAGADGDRTAFPADADRAETPADRSAAILRTEAHPFALQTSPRTITADYVSEIRPGDRLTVGGYRQGRSFFFFGKEAGSEKIKFRIRIAEEPESASGEGAG